MASLARLLYSQSNVDDGTDDSSDFSDKQNNLLVTVTVVESVASFICSGLIVFSFYQFKKLRKFSLLLVFLLSISDMGVCVSYFLGNPRNGDFMCYSQAVVMSFFELASVLWTTVIAFTLYRLIIEQKTSTHLIYRFHAFAFGLPAVFSLLPFTTGSYGNVGAWCWITTDADATGYFDPGTVWRLSLFYMPLWITIAYNSVVYVMVTNSLQRVANTQSQHQRPKYLKMVRRLRMYPLILVFCWAGATINRLQNTVDPHNSQFFLYVSERKKRQEPMRVSAASAKKAVRVSAKRARRRRRCAASTRLHWNRR